MKAIIDAQYKKVPTRPAQCLFTEAKQIAMINMLNSRKPGAIPVNQNSWQVRLRPFNEYSPFGQGQKANNTISEYVIELSIC